MPGSDIVRAMGGGEGGGGGRGRGRGASGSGRRSSGLWGFMTFVRKSCPFSDPSSYHDFCRPFIVAAIGIRTLWGNKIAIGHGSSHIVMAGLGPAIHVFAARIKERRGWPAFAGHDDGGVAPRDNPGSTVIA